MNEMDRLRLALGLAADRLGTVASWIEHGGNPIHAGIVRQWVLETREAGSMPVSGTIEGGPE